VGDAEPLGGLRAEYAAGSGVFVAKIDALSRSYGRLRRTRGDGPRRRCVRDLALRAVPPPPPPPALRTPSRRLHAPSRLGAPNQTKLAAAGV
jgi:hypothetical protein